MPALKNPRHEAFANEVFKGMPKGQKARDAFRKIYPKGKDSALDAAASRLLKRVKSRIQELQATVQVKNALTMSERRDFLYRVVKANLKTFDTEADGDLLEELTEEDGKTRFRLPSKRGCIIDDARLAGELIDRQDLTTEGEALPSVLPTIVINVPASFGKRRGG